MGRDRSGLGDGLPRRLRSAAARRLAVDARALAALRVGVGLLLLADLGLRAGDLVAFYTDAGVLPRSALAARSPAFAAASLHALSGAAWFEALLFAVAAGFAVALLLGYHTRVATVASLVLLVSLHLRNPVVLNGGDSLLRRLLLWGVFLPLGGRWSVDAVRGVRRDGRVVGLASAALLLQVVLVYATNAVYKLQGRLWRSGQAIQYVFRLDGLTVGLGDALAHHPALLVALDRLWLAMLVGSVLLVVLTGRRRTALVSLFVGAHVAMAATMRLGLFPAISIVALLAFLPAGVWDRVETALSGSRWPALGGSWVPSRPRPRPPPALAVAAQRAAPALVAVLLAAVLVWNAAAIGLVGLPAGVTSTVDPHAHRWDMFAPEPRTTDGWYVAPGRLASGGTVDAFHGGPVTWTRPPELSASYPSHRWYVYLQDLRRPAYADLRPAFGRYLCRRWNDGHDVRLVAVTVYFVAERVRLDGPPTHQRVELYDGTCPTGAD